MKIKKPSVRGMDHMSYLGHFAKDCCVQAGHNFSASRLGEELASVFKKKKETASAGEEMTADEKFRHQQKMEDEESEKRSAKK